MRDALLADLREIRDVELFCCYDHRLSAPAVEHAIMIDTRDDIWQVWQDLINQSDAVWLIAPESSGILLRLTELVAAQDKLLLGCPPSAVRLTSSKLATCHVLMRAGISCVSTYGAQEWLAGEWRGAEETGWVVKPDDGVSCEDSVHLHSVKDVTDWLMQGRQLTHVVQPWHPGDAGSLSMLCHNGQAWLLSCNRQKVLCDSGRFVYQGSIVNGLSEHWEPFERLAQQIARMLPDLAAYVGVDLMVADDGQLTLEVLEINPRLTTSYVGLRQAAGVNVAALILDLLAEKSRENVQFYLPKISKNIVEITL